MMQQPQGKVQPPGLLRRQYIAQQQTMSQPTPFPPQQSPVSPSNYVPQPQPPFPGVPPAVLTPTPVPDIPKKKRTMRIFAAFLVIGLAAALYFVWNTSSSPTTSTPGISQQNFSTTSSSNSTSASTSVATTDGIRVYVVGAVKNPGIYTLASGARVYDLLQAAGGTLPNANLVALNLAAKLSDGQEVYVTLIGETPPTYIGGVSGPGNVGTGGGSGQNTQLVNINTASVDELNQNLHISKKSAQTIVDYRTQHGKYMDTIYQ